jgi:nitroimidazol reductase NimA-like FMN-containing flavoprotein (pyridoxamine 5'-phosphate oxidase superfamily)
MPDRELLAARGFADCGRSSTQSKQKILALLEGHRIMTIATVRPDGWPQATTVGYVNEGLTLWFLCGLESQKAKNLAHDNRVSITIDHDTPDIMSITGLSMAARAYRVSDRAEAQKVIGMLPLKYPDAPPATAQLKMPTPEDVALFRVVPEIISVLDYTKGFAHTDLVTC